MGIQNKKFEYLKKLKMKVSTFLLATIVCGTASVRIPGLRTMRTSNSFRSPKISSISSRPSFTSPGRTSGLSLPKPPTFTSRLSSSTGLLNRSKSLLGLGGTSRGLLGRSQTGVGGLSSTGTSTGRWQSVRNTILPNRRPVGGSSLGVGGTSGVGGSSLGTSSTRWQSVRNSILPNRPPVGTSQTGVGGSSPGASSRRQSVRNTMLPNRAGAAHTGVGGVATGTSPSGTSKPGMWQRFKNNIPFRKRPTTGPDGSGPPHGTSQTDVGGTPLATSNTVQNPRSSMSETIGNLGIGAGVLGTANIGLGVAGLVMQNNQNDAQLASSERQQAAQMKNEKNNRDMQQKQFEAQQNSTAKSLEWEKEVHRSTTE